MRKSAIPAHVPRDRVYEFDIFYDSSVGGDVQKTHMALHEAAPDIFYTPMNGGHWMATRFADVKTIMTTPEVFSSRENNFPPAPPFVKLSLPPQDMDAPDHMRHRMLLLKFLAPKEVTKLEPQVRQLVNELINAVLEKHGCEFVAEVAVPLPVKSFMTMMQWDVSKYRQLVRWANAILATDSLWKAMPAFFRMTMFLKGLIRQRVKMPGNDPISLLLASELDGKPIGEKRVLEMCNLLFLAGLDTVTNAMTFITKHLAEHPDIQQRLRDNPDQIPGAIEEFLRRYSFVNAPRKLTKDFNIGDVKLRRGDLIVSSFAAASNDNRSVDHPEQLNLDRDSSPHLAFNTGPHNCAGATLARLELRVFLEEWLKRVPKFAPAPGNVVKARGGPVMAIEAFKLAW